MSEKVLESAKRALEECRPKDAIAALEPLVEHDDEDVDALVYLGIAYVQAEMPEKAVEVLYRADELVEQHYVVELFLGRALWALGKVTSAEEHILEALRLDSTQPEPWADLGRIYLHKHQYRKALEHLGLPSARFPDDVDIVSLHALVLYRLWDLTAATKEWARVHALEPKLMTAVSNYAYVLLLQERSFEAAPFVGYANNMNPDDYRSLILLGELRFQSGDREGALDCFRRVLSKDSGNIEALSRVAIIAHNSHDDEACRKYLARCEKELGNDPESWRGLCAAYPYLGMRDEYVDCLIRWTIADKDAAAPWVMLAREYDRQGKLEHAANAWRIVFELRGYVKARCPSCTTETRLPYDSVSGFDICADKFCEACGAVMYMPGCLPYD